MLLLALKRVATQSPQPLLSCTTHTCQAGSQCRAHLLGTQARPTLCDQLCEPSKTLHFGVWGKMGRAHRGWEGKWLSNPLSPATQSLGKEWFGEGTSATHMWHIYPAWARSGERRLPAHPNLSGDQASCVGSGRSQLPPLSCCH